MTLLKATSRFVAPMTTSVMRTLLYASPKSKYRQHDIQLPSRPIHGMTDTSSSVSTSLTGGNQIDILVVGGGLGGLAAAAALRTIAKLENVHVIESREDSITNDRAGAAMQLGPNAFKALQAIGGDELLEDIYQQGSILKETVMLVPGTVMRIPNTDEENTGYPTLLIRWGVLRRLLAELLPKSTLNFGVGNDIAGYQLSDDRNKSSSDTAIVRPVAQNGESISVGAPFPPQLIVAADGLNSVFRRCILNEATVLSKEATSTIQDNGRVNIKAAVPVELAQLGEAFATPQASFAQFNPQVACFAGPAGPGFTYWAISIGDVGGAPFFAELKNPKDEMVAAKKLLLDKLEGISSEEVNRDWIISLVEETDPSTILINRSLEAPVQEDHSFVSKDGKVVLLGDAAHAMNPAYGQSASFAFEDAAILAKCIEDKHDDDSLEDALQAYSEKRVMRCMEMQRRSEERAAKTMRGEKAEDVSKWIYEWEL